MMQYWVHVFKLAGRMRKASLPRWQGWVESKLRILYKNMEGLRGVQLRPSAAGTMDLRGLALPTRKQGTTPRILSLGLEEERDLEQL